MTPDQTPAKEDRISMNCDEAQHLHRHQSFLLLFAITWAPPMRSDTGATS